MFNKKIKIPPHVLDKVRVAAELSGASSVDEFIAQILEREAERIIADRSKQQASAEEVEDIANKLKGLGYLE